MRVKYRLESGSGRFAPLEWNAWGMDLVCLLLNGIYARFSNVRLCVYENISLSDSSRALGPYPNLNQVCWNIETYLCEIHIWCINILLVPVFLTSLLGLLVPQGKCESVKGTHAFFICLFTIVVDDFIITPCLVHILWYSCCDLIIVKRNNHINTSAYIALFLANTHELVELFPTNCYYSENIFSLKRTPYLCSCQCGQYHGRKNRLLLFSRLDCRTARRV